MGINNTNYMRKAKIYLLALVIPGFFSHSLAQESKKFERLVIDAEPPIKSIWAKGKGDFNGDGHIDFMIAGEGSVIWYENPAGSNKKKWERHIAYSGPNVGFEGCATGDINNNGHVDIVIGGYHTNMVYILENPGNGKGSWKLHAIGGPKTDATYLHDIDGDGKLEIITRASELWSGGVGREVFIWKQQGKDPFSPSGWRRDRGNRRDVGTGEHFNIGDVDGDGKMDIVVANAWFKNNGSVNVSNWTKTVFTEEWTHDCAYPFVADINNDGRNDIVLTPTERYPQMYKTAWYEAPADPSTGNWKEHIVDGNVQCITHALGVYDFNNDGWLDIFTAEMEQSDDPDEVRIYFNNGSGTSWTKEILSLNGSHWNQFADVDSDGDIDIFGANHGSQGQPVVELWINQTNPPKPISNFKTIRIDDKRELPQSFGLDAADVTRNGFKDIVAGKYFYRNPGGDMTGKWHRAELPGAPNMDAVLIIDVDGDQYGDVIGLSLPGVYWLEADDVQGNSWSIRAKIGEIPLGPHGTSSQGYTTAQIVPGGKPEIILGSRGVYYFEIPVNPEKGNWPMTRIIDSPNSEEGLGTGDINRNGLIDVVGCINKDGVPNQVGWYENPGDGSADWTYHQVGTVARYADRFYVADVNGNGRKDIILSTANGEEDGVYWFEAPENPRDRNWKKHTVIVQEFSNSLDIADFNNNGHIDIILGQHYTRRQNTPRKIQIFENDGKGNFKEHLISTGIESHLGARVFDLNSNGKLDIVTVGYIDHQYLYIFRNDGNQQIAQ
jgi:hypothetical protein